MMPQQISYGGMEQVDAVKFSIENGYPPVLLSPHGAWRHMRVLHHHYTSLEIYQPPHQQIVVTLNLTGPVCVERHRAGNVETAIRPLSAVGIYPPGQPARWIFGQPFSALHLVLETDLFVEVSESSLSQARVEILNRTDFIDATIQNLCLLLSREVEGGCLGGQLYGDSLATALAAHLLRYYAAFPATFREYRRGLSKSDLQRCLDFIADHLAEDLSLAQLAACAHLSPYHFARLFKQSMDLSPHQYVLAQRIEKAKSLLLTGRLPVGEIAYFVGFGNQAHFNRHFKRLTGVTPLRFRKG